jgi:hypothetical protein
VRDGDGNKRVMTAAKRVVGNKEGNDNKDGNGNSNKGIGGQRGLW